MRWMRRGRRTPWGAVLVVLGLLGGGLLGVGAIGEGLGPAVAAEPVLAERAAAEPVATSPAGRAAGLQDFTFDSLHVDYELGRTDDGVSTLRVTETFTARFPDADQNQGMRRTIPARYLGVPTHPSFVSVTDASGAPRPAEVESDDDVLVITSRGDGFVHGVQTYVFTYELEQVTRFFDDTGVDEFYWNVNGLDWEQPFGEVSARLVVASELAPALTGALACYRGAQGATELCAIEAVSDGAGGASIIDAQALGLGPHQTMTIAVGFEAGTFTPFDASALASPWAWMLGLGAALTLGSLVLTVWMRRARLRDAPGRPVIVAEYEPPREVDALEAAVLLGTPTRGISAEVLEQAIVGSIRIVEGAPRRWLGPTFELHLVDPARADADGLALLDGLFGLEQGVGVPERTVFELGKSSSRASSTAAAILRAADSVLLQRGLRRRVPFGTRTWPILVAVAAGATSVTAGVLALDGGTDALLPVLVLVGGMLAFVISVVLMARRPLTALGAQVRDHLKGLKVFIEWAEADRIRMLQSPRGAERAPLDPAGGDPRAVVRLYERLLPFAVVFGQEKEWATQLAFYYGDAQPGWYFGSGAFNAAAFSSSISALSASTTSSASTSGGSSGGGSAGGGGGGGGGGGV
ncbi:MAG TPA: DUF2207 domain-containing protein [Microbacteriaceae bacterium]|nr:DUF2207 domain-containing protein [Microbacteriaceae bacterium]HPZ35129.1 DUF2207 domain-containing protein [Microbacteriaceae bacterium]HQC93360.1 DUF2207 domain-containing protein [Microbacteriaceae bacterium]